MNNPMQIMQMVKNSSPQQFMQQIMGNHQMMSNPMIKNAMDMYQQGDMKGIETMARNICQEKGVNPEEMLARVKEQFKFM